MVGIKKDIVKYGLGKVCYLCKCFPTWTNKIHLKVFTIFG